MVQADDRQGLCALRRAWRIPTPSSAKGNIRPAYAGAVVTSVEADRLNVSVRLDEPFIVTPEPRMPIDPSASTSRLTWTDSSPNEPYAREKASLTTCAIESETLSKLLFSAVVARSKRKKRRSPPNR